jgi:hypothetical protein
MNNHTTFSNLFDELSADIIEMCDMARYFYAEMLYRWGLYEKRAEVLKYFPSYSKLVREEESALGKLIVADLFCFIYYSHRAAHAM